jgi:hypothetical protein
VNRKVFIFLGAFLVIGVTLVGLSIDRIAPGATAQNQNLTVSVPNRYAVEIQSLSSGRQVSQAVSAPVLSNLDATNRYALEKHNILPGQEEARIAAVSSLSVLDTTDRYALEKHNFLPGREVTKKVSVPVLSILDTTERYALELNNVMSGGEDRQYFLAIREATRDFKWSEAALDAGFIQLFDCIENQSDASIGAMGVHFIEPTRFDDQLVLEEPEVLVYELKSDGRMKLVAVEYIIPAAAWNQETPPVFLGQELKYKTTMGQYGQADGIDPYYEVHVWAWKHNPSGFFADWNPQVSCPTQ